MFLCNGFPKAGLGIGMICMGFFVCLGFPFGGERGSLNGHKVQKEDFTCESLVVKFLGQVAEPISEWGVETPRN